MKDFKFKKKYGQNFLIDNNVLEKIVSNLKVTNNDLIVEIGPGSGNLTKKLINFNSKIIAYEIDLDTKDYLNMISYQDLLIYYDDILKRNVKEDISKVVYEDLYIIGNLPYYITTPIIEKLTKENLNPKEMYFMVQKEVAERLSAKPKSKQYGYITVLLNYYYDVTKIFDVNRTSFYPAPKVDSSIIRLKLHNKYNIKDENKFINLIKNSFAHKRKTLLNNLYMYDKEIIKIILLKNNYNLMVRAEELPIEIFLEISASI